MFFDIKGRDIRVKTLELMAAKYQLSFTDKQIEQFRLMEGFGVPIGELAAIIDMKSDQRNKEGQQKGIPFDSINNQLKDWIYTARQANIELNGASAVELHFAIKGDAKLEYPKIRKIMDIYQDQKINSFDLVTGLRGKDY